MPTLGIVFGISIGSLGRDKSDLLNGEGPVNSLFRRNDCGLFVMRVTRYDGAADESGPFPHMSPDALDDRVFDSSMAAIVDADNAIDLLAKLQLRRLIVL